jgi:uncharacterized protein YciU (UPF0263 family)
MDAMTELFSGVNFKSTIQKYCREIGWKVAEVDENFARLVFSMQSGRDQAVLITRYDTTLEFMSPSIGRASSEDDIPDFIARKLLLRNSENKVGFWCMRRVEGEYYLVYMHNAEIQLLNRDFFAAIARTLIQECDRLDGILEKIL